MSQQEHQADIETWQALWDRSDKALAASRLERERTSMRWNNLRSYIEKIFGSRQLRCVELGSGEGDFSVLLAELGHQVTLVDFTDQALNRARLRFESLGLKARYVYGDLFKYAREHTGQYDLSLSVGLAEHFSGDRREDVIQAHRRVLHGGGITFISVPNYSCLPYRIRKFYMECRGIWPYGYEAPFSGRELKRIAQRTGFSVCKTYNTGFASSVDWCVLAPLRGSSLGWQDGPRWINSLNGWAVNLLAQAA